MKTQRSILLLCLAMVACAPGIEPSTSPPALAIEKTLSAELDSLLDAPGLPVAFWGVEVRSMETGELLYARNATRLFAPASNTKLITASVALARLGADYRYRTQLHAAGPIEDGRLDGDLVVTGEGDPTLDPAALRQWTGQLRRAGLVSIEGDLVGIDGAFDDERLGSGWVWNNLTSEDAAEVSALQFDENVVRVTLHPGESPGDAVEVGVEPPTAYVEVDHRLRTSERSSSPKVRWKRGAEDNRIVIDGRLPARSADVELSIAVFDPARFTLFALRDALESGGIEVRGTVTTVEQMPSNAADGATLVSHESSPLGEILTRTLKDSQNLFAETVLKTLGREVYDEGSARAGIWVVQKNLSKLGIPADSYVVTDGSGLSHYNLLSPALIVGVLREMYRHDASAAFIDALPVAGVDGTLRDRMRGTAAEGNVRAKTGSLAKASALSGYVTTARNETLAFSILANNFNAPHDAVEAVQDRICAHLAQLERER